MVRLPRIWPRKGQKDAKQADAAPGGACALRRAAFECLESRMLLATNGLAGAPAGSSPLALATGAVQTVLTNLLAPVLGGGSCVLAILGLC